MAYFQLEEGRKEHHLGKLDSARQRFKNALKIDNDSIYPYIALGDSFAFSEKWTEAIKWYKELIVRFPSKSELIAEKLQKAFYEKGDFSEIIELYIQLLKDDPENTKLAISLSKIYSKMGKYEQAVDVLSKLEEILDKEDKLFLIDFYRKLNKPDQVNRLADTLVKEISDNIKKYKCEVCGYETENILWRCPRCNNFDTFNL